MGSHKRMRHGPTRILWVTFDFPPRLSSGVFRPIKIYKYLDKRNFEVDFVTHGEAVRFQHALLDESLVADMQPSPRVVRVPTIIPHDLLPALINRLRGRSSSAAAPRTDAPTRPNAAHAPEPAAAPRTSGLGSRLYRRMAMGLYFPDHLFLWGWLASAASLWAWLRRRHDLVYTTSHPESAHLPGLLLRTFGVRWVADYRYGGPLWIKHLAGYPKSPLRERLDRRFQRLVLRRADRVIVQSEPIRDDFCATFGLDPSRVTVIPNGYDEHDFHNGHHDSRPFPAHDNEVHLVHVGAMEGVGPAERRQLIEALNRLADGLRESGRELVIEAVGSDIFGDEHRRAATHFGYRHHGTVAHGDLLPYLRAADCFLLSTVTSTTGSDGVKGFIPGKLWEYLRAGGPILMAGPKDEVWKILDESGLGLHLGLNGDGALPPDALLGRLQPVKVPHPTVVRHSWESRAQSFERVFLRVMSEDAGNGRPERHV